MGTVSLQSTFLNDDPVPAVPWYRTGSGLLISLLLHAALLVLWQGWQAKPPALAPAQRIIELRLQPIAKPAPPPAVDLIPPPQAPIATTTPKPALTPTPAKPTPAKAAAATARIARPKTEEEEQAVPEAPSRAAPIQADLAPAAGHIDLEAAKRIAREAGQEGSKSAPPAYLAKPAPERETALGKGINQSERADCREAYAGLGLLAVPLLLKDAATGGGCKW
ncbi:pyruvate/2-oxoglutarate dehydrogenase complex dihydrolipoamide acyltransferase (E2) component [Chitinivorax tropicus]|uniref:Pyruvate/2-oxoglutarate dehydrogenase complex dihydrolipoamide acyltransferase (E2) component n=1 Tax=Chitinivorax tropicus TaxID=714531 RepID=A0A840MPJ7_9PROT|nr:hypothetical protein [Chitinivorax tropicus]MBB5018103.1 pyruvate/2-oxoglutarate dehydrogenase complex dihydrolipoamide acyltransferase (E2) component [Chitinivorax tropicus]